MKSMRLLMVINFVLIFAEDSQSEYDSENEEEQGVIQLEVNLESGGTAKLIIMNEEKFEDDVINFCKLHNLDDGKRRKL